MNNWMEAKNRQNISSALLYLSQVKPSGESILEKDYHLVVGILHRWIGESYNGDYPRGTISNDPEIVLWTTKMVLAVVIAGNEIPQNELTLVYNTIEKWHAQYGKEA